MGVTFMPTHPLPLPNLFPLLNMVIMSLKFLLDLLGLFGLLDIADYISEVTELLGSLVVLLYSTKVLFFICYIDVMLLLRLIHSYCFTFSFYILLSFI